MSKPTGMADIIKRSRAKTTARVQIVSAFEGATLIARRTGRAVFVYGNGRKFAFVQGVEEAPAGYVLLATVMRDGASR